MNDYERARREHPAQWHQDQRTFQEAVQTLQNKDAK